MDVTPFVEGWGLLLSGLRGTLVAAALCLVVSLFVGVLLGSAHELRIGPLRAAIRFYVYFFRGTPVIVLLFLSYFGLPAMGLRLGALEAGVLAIGLNSSAHIVEVVRSSVQSVDVEQHEAAAIDGAGPLRTLYSIIFPQAIATMVAPTTNELISVVKNTSLLAVISVAEVTRAGQLLAARYFTPFEVYFFLAAVYLILSSILTRLSVLLERRVNFNLYRASPPIKRDAR